DDGPHLDRVQPERLGQPRRRGAGREVPRRLRSHGDHPLAALNGQRGDRRRQRDGDDLPALRLEQQWARTPRPSATGRLLRERSPALQARCLHRRRRRQLRLLRDVGLPVSDEPWPLDLTDWPNLCEGCQRSLLEQAIFGTGRYPNGEQLSILELLVTLYA